MRVLWIILIGLPVPGFAESMVATRTVRAQTVLAAEDVAMVDADIPGALTDPNAAIGQEARVTLYAGRPIRAEDLGSAALVERNQVVSLAYQVDGLSILTEGRALARGSAGDQIKVMNLASHTTVSGTIGADGVVLVGPDPKG